MKVVGLKEITKKDTPLHYRGEYSGTAVVEVDTNLDVECRLSFVLERSATGSIGVTINLLEEIPYPVVPVLGALKSYILEQEKTGRFL